MMLGGGGLRDPLQIGVVSRGRSVTWQSGWLNLAYAAVREGGGARQSTGLVHIEQLLHHPSLLDSSREPKVTCHHSEKYNTSKYDIPFPSIVTTRWKLGSDLLFRISKTHRPSPLLR